MPSLNRIPSCPDLDTLLQLTLGLLSEDAARPVEVHLESCQRCAENLERSPGRDTGLTEWLGRSSVLTGPDRQFVDHLVADLHRSGPWSLLAPAGRSAETRRTVRDTPPLFEPGSTGPEAVSTFHDFLSPSSHPTDLGCLGKYRVLRELGRGGMAVVFLAEDTQLRRQVALKVILDNRACDPRYTARFGQEAEALARLRHPNIVQIYEIGTHRGRPFFALEYVEGGNLAEALAKRTSAPALRDAASLTAILAHALHHAHVRGIVHRDLKPGNVLLVGDPELFSRASREPQTLEGPHCTPKVSDFGLAKRLDEEGLTQTGDVIGTPSYMAPELIRGLSGNSGPEVDIYSLGAILYELLTGRPPFLGASVLETLEQARTLDPIPPRRLSPDLPRDLETICLKCLAREPRRRFASAQELADDLERFLRGEPILARPTSGVERLGRWVRRRPALAVLLAVSTVSLLTLIGGGLWYNLRLQDAVAQTQQERERVIAGYQSARDTLNLMIGRLERRQLGEVPELKALQLDLLTDALTFYERSLQEAQDQDPAVRLDAAEAYERAGYIHQLLNRLVESEKYFRRSLELLAGLPSDLARSTEARNLEAQCLARLGLLLNAVNKPEEAGLLLQRSVAVAVQLAAEDPGNPLRQEMLALTEHNLGQLLHLRGRPAEAEGHYRRAVDIRTRLIAGAAEPAAYQIALAEDYVNFGMLLANTGRPEEASEAYKKGEELLRRLIARDPANIRHTLALAAMSNNWSYLLRHTGKPDLALEKATVAVVLGEEALQREPRYHNARDQTFRAHGCRAEMYQSLGRWSEAVKDWDRVVDLDDQPDRSVMRILRALALGRAGDHARITAEARDLAVLKGVSDDGRRDLARALGFAFSRAQADATLDSAQRHALAESHAGQALQLLSDLKTRGYFADSQRAESLRKDEAWTDLRARKDFQALLETSPPGKPD